MEKIKNYVETVLQPKLQGDGGWVEFVGLDGDELTLIFRGECSKCLILNRCTAWIEEQIKKSTLKWSDVQCVLRNGQICALAGLKDIFILQSGK